MTRAAGCLLSLAVLALASCRGAVSGAGGAECSDCSVLLVSVDTLRADHLSLYGYERPTSPNLERFARDAVVFDQVVNNGGGTLPVHISMFTSLLPSVHDVTPKSQRALEPERVTLAEQLAERGYRTAAFTDAGWLIGRLGFGQGFELFDEEGGRLAAILPKALDWLEEHGDEPFFLFLHTYDVHSEWERLPYDCPGDYPDRYDPGYAGDFDGCLFDECASNALLAVNDRIRQDPSFDVRQLLSEKEIEYIVARYDGCINYVDDQLQRLFDRLVELDLYDDTLIVVTSDHGEEFLDHGLLLHQNLAYEELIRVPLVVKFPHSAWAGRRVPHLATTIDLMPSILDVLGIPPNPDVQGTSLLPLLAEGGPVRRDAQILGALRTERWKFMMRGRDRYLFDLAADPGERLNLAAEHPELLERMEADLRRRQRADREAAERFEAARNGIETRQDLTPEEIERLKALGYLQ